MAATAGASASGTVCGLTHMSGAASTTAQPVVLVHAISSDGVRKCVRVMRELVFVDEAAESLVSLDAGERVEWGGSGSSDAHVCKASRVQQEETTREVSDRRRPTDPTCPPLAVLHAAA